MEPDPEEDVLAIARHALEKYTMLSSFKTKRERMLRKEGVEDLHAAKEEMNVFLRKRLQQRPATTGSPARPRKKNMWSNTKARTATRRSQSPPAAVPQRKLTTTSFGQMMYPPRPQRYTP